MPHVIDGVEIGRSGDQPTKRAQHCTDGAHRCFRHATNWPKARQKEDASRRTCADLTRPCRLWTAVARRDERSGLDDRKLPLRRRQQNSGDTNEAAGSAPSARAGRTPPNHRQNLERGHLKVLSWVWGQRSQQGRRRFDRKIDMVVAFFGHGLGCWRTLGCFWGRSRTRS